MSYRKITDPDKVWGDWFAGDAFQIDKRLRQVFRVLPRDPRCKFCSAPFEGPGGRLVKMIFGKERSTLNPLFCNMCEQASRQFPGGNEVAMAMLFADIRNSTGLAERMSPTEFSRLIGRFYKAAARLITGADGLVDKLVGDEVTAFWGAGFAGPEYVRRAVDAARELARQMTAEGIPVGASVHSGVAYFGAIGAADGLTDITALGDEVNLAARLASQAAAGEVLVSRAVLDAAGIDPDGLEVRRLELKGVSQPVDAYVLGAPGG